MSIVFVPQRLASASVIFFGQHVDIPRLATNANTRASVYIVKPIRSYAISRAAACSKKTLACSSR